MFPLGLLSAGEKGEVIETREVTCDSGGRRSIAGIKGTACRMADMGLRSGKVIEMLNNEGRGPLLVKVDNARLAIGRAMAMKIIVRRSNI